MPEHTVSTAIPPALTALNGHIKWTDLDAHGYGVFTVTAAAAQMDRYFLHDKNQRRTGQYHARSFRVRNGSTRVTPVTDPIRKTVPFARPKGNPAMTTRSLSRPMRIFTGVAAVSVIALAPATAGQPGVATAAPADTGSSTTDAPAVATPSVIRLAGAENTRTFAAYTTTSGKHISPAVIRSDNLSKLTAADIRTLRSLKLTSIVDLRTQIESTVQPSRAIPGATRKNYDVLGQTPITNLIDLPSAYRAFVTAPTARAAFRKTLLDIKNTTSAGNSVLFHCSAGKDRTGWTSALLLSILGVDRATIERDYLASNTYRHASPSDPLNGVRIEWQRTSFAAADSKYGSLDGYLRKGLGLTTTDMNTLRANLLR